VDRFTSVRDVGAPLWRLQGDQLNAQLVERWLPNGLARLLKTDLYDEAVSAGLYPTLSSRADRVTGIDVSPRVVTAARERYDRLEAFVADARALPFDADSFDAIVSNSTLDHFADESQFVLSLKELARVLRPGGHLVITMDNPLNPLLALRNRLPRRFSRWLRRGFPYDAGWTCGPSRLRELLEAQGFEVRDQTAILHAPRALVALVDSPSPAAEKRHLRQLQRAEALERLPTRYISGHFIAAHAIAPHGPSSPPGAEISD
jgi:SAM-dependent methyltransferase